VLDAADGPALDLGPFDVVIVGPWLEQERRPHETLTALRDRLAPGGLLVVIVPNREHSDGRYRAPGDGSVRHFFTPASTAELLAASGFLPVETWPPSHDGSVVVMSAVAVAGADAHLRALASRLVAGDAARVAASRAEQRAQEAEAQVRALEATKLFRWSAPARSVYRRVRERWRPGRADPPG
jgi:hypothetical protein